MFGWGTIAFIVVMAFVLSALPWGGTQSLSGPPGSDFGVPVGLSTGKNGNPGNSLVNGGHLPAASSTESTNDRYGEG